MVPGSHADIQADSRMVCVRELSCSRNRHTVPVLQHSPLMFKVQDLLCMSVLSAPRVKHGNKGNQHIEKVSRDTSGSSQLLGGF